MNPLLENEMTDVEVSDPIISFDFENRQEWSDDELMMKFVTYLHSGYNFITLEYPPVGKLLSDLNISQKRFNDLLPRINNSLIKRGYEPYTYEMDVQVIPRGAKELDPFFVIAVDLITDTIDKRSTSVKLKQAGLTSQRWNFLLKDKHHHAYFKKVHQEKFKAMREVAEIALSKNIEGGDLGSIKYFMELENIYRPETGIDNLGVLIAKLMEILVQYIQPSQLQEVAEKFEGAIHANSKELTV